MPSGVPHGDDFRMRRGIPVADGPVPSFADDPPVLNHHSTHRHFLAVSRLRRQFQCPTHEVDVARRTAHAHPARAERILSEKNMPVITMNNTPALSTMEL